MAHEVRTCTVSGEYRGEDNQQLWNTRSIQHRNVKHMNTGQPTIVSNHNHIVHYKQSEEVRLTCAGPCPSYLSHFLVSMQGMYVCIIITQLFLLLLVFTMLLTDIKSAGI